MSFRRVTMYQIYSENNTNTQIGFIRPNQTNLNQWNSFSEYLTPEDKESSENAKSIGRMFPQHDDIQFDL